MFKTEINGNSSLYFDCSQCYIQEDLVHMALETWVKIVEGKLIALDRYELTAGHKKDFLIL